jgi:hypothetical protein
VVTGERDGHRFGCERQFLCPDIAGGDMLTLYHGRFALSVSGRRKGSYFPSESEDIDLK